MTRDEIVDEVDGRVVGGQPNEQDEAIGWIATFLASVGNKKLLDIDWIVVIPFYISTWLRSPKTSCKMNRSNLLLLRISLL